MSRLAFRIVPLHGHRVLNWLLLATVLVLVWQCTRAQAAIGDNYLAREVGHEILTLPYYRVFDNLTFRVEGNTVTLLGEVTEPALRNAAEKAVERIPGVHSVVNQIEVLLPSSADDRLRLTIFAATYGQMMLNEYAVMAVPPVHIVVTKGNVTLEGTVTSPMDKSQFFTSASAVPGVVSVTDHIQVAP